MWEPGARDDNYGRKGRRGREKPSGGHRPPFTSEATKTRRYSDTCKLIHTWDLIPDPKISCSSHAMIAILLLLGSAWAQIPPCGGY